MAITNENLLHETLDSRDFDAEIQAHGIDIGLRAGIACACVSKETGSPDPSCNLCDGFARIWASPITIRAYGPNRRINRLFEVPGGIDIGDAEFSFPSATFVGHLDRFIVPSEIIVYSEFFTKGAVNALTKATKEKSRFDTIISPIERAIWTKRNPQSGFPYSYELFELVEGKDFAIVNGNQISWLDGGSRPDEGARYVIRFRTQAEYLVFAPRARAEGSQQMPSRYLCKRLDFIRAPQ